MFFTNMMKVNYFLPNLDIFILYNYVLPLHIYVTSTEGFSGSVHLLLPLRLYPQDETFLFIPCGALPTVLPIQLPRKYSYKLDKINRYNLFTDVNEHKNIHVLSFNRKKQATSDPLPSVFYDSD